MSNKIKLTVFGEKGAPFITNPDIETPVLCYTHIGHLHFSTVLCATKLKAPQVGT